MTRHSLGLVIAADAHSAETDTFRTFYYTCIVFYVLFVCIVMFYLYCYQCYAV